MNRDERSRRAMALAHKYAKRRFAGQHDREERIADAESWAWEIAQQAGSRATPSTIAWYAVKRVSTERRYRESSVSIDSPRHRPSRESVGFDVRDAARTGDDPALIVQVRLDLLQWLATLSGLHRTVAMLFATGWRTSEIAELVKRSPGRVSQIRDELRQVWREFQDG